MAFGSGGKGSNPEMVVAAYAREIEKFGAAFPKGGTVLSRDQRSICSITWPDNQTIETGPSAHGLIQIVAYDENGECATVPWLAVINDGQIVKRVPAGQVSIEYFKHAVIDAAFVGEAKSAP